MSLSEDPTLEDYEGDHSYYVEEGEAEGTGYDEEQREDEGEEGDEEEEEEQRDSEYEEEEEEEEEEKMAPKKADLPRKSHGHR